MLRFVLVERAVIGAGSTITRDVEADAIAVARGEQTVSEGGAGRRRERTAKAKAGD